MPESHLNNRLKDQEVIPDVISAVAEETGADPEEMPPPLADVIDPDALQRLLHSPSVVRISFGYRGREIVIRPDGDTTIRPLASRD